MIDEAILKADEIKANLMSIGNTEHFYASGLLTDKDYARYKDDITRNLEIALIELSTLIEEISYYE